MQTLSAQDVAIAMAIRSSTLLVVKFQSRFGDWAWSVEDGHGVIETFDSKEALDERVNAIRDRIL